ncbi:MAG: 4-hydroxy-tetrahydrodipicolinate synthase [Gammaproteobacteria bacterium]|nr:4-hydroxy-tetrahydrodipicolinate synthase [Gammaproteobacteria bacterium]
MNQLSKAGLSGSLVALITPMNPNGDINFEDLDKLVNYHINNQTNGLVVLGTTGENPTVNIQERKAIISRVLKQVNHRIPVIIGTGHNCTRETITLTQQAEELGADGALVVTPYYNKPSQKGLIAHYKTVVSNTSLPIILYNVPGRTACDLQPETVAELASNPKIIGLKEAVSSPERIEQLVYVCPKDPKDFALLSGDDETFVDFLEAGGHGVISVTANIAPKEISEICRQAKLRNWAQCQELNKKLANLHQSLFLSANPVPVKWALYYLNLITSPDCRLPLLSLESKFQTRLITALQESGILTTQKAI